ncbi:MAG: GNAT family N-acetyltransferase [Clostridium sp.]|nr:GNAT family N-acetyltransferase [Clostridium sp.]
MKSAYRDIKWVTANKDKEEGDFTEFLFEGPYGKISYRFFKKYAGTIDDTKYYDIASYRGAEGPYILQVDDGKAEKLLDEFIEKFKEYCVKENIIAEFAKLDPWDEYAKLIRQKLCAEYYGNFYCNNLENDFYSKEYNRRCKRSIKKAREQGVETSIDLTGKTIPYFVKLYKNTEEKFHTSHYYNMSESDIKKFFDAFGEEAFLINAIYNNEIVTSVLVVMGEDVEHYLLLGNNPKYLDLQCNSLLTYEAALYGQKRGKKIFDMGGGKLGGGIEKFKRNFISDEGVWEYYAVKKIHNQKIYDLLVERKGQISNAKFFPLYRG